MKRRYIITVRMTPAERAMLEAIAAHQGQSISSTVRQIISAAGKGRENTASTAGGQQAPIHVAEERERPQ